MLEPGARHFEGPLDGVKKALKALVDIASRKVEKKPHTVDAMLQTKRQKDKYQTKKQK